MPTTASRRGRQQPRNVTNLPDGKQSTVAAAVADASPGSTLLIPAGSWTWDRGVAIDKELILKGTSTPAPASPGKGPGTSSSIITRGWSDGNTGFFTLKPKSDVPVRVSGLKMVQPNGSTSNHAAVVIQGPQSGAPLKQIRIDNCYFDQGCQTIWWQGGAYGLTDHCHFADIWICVIIYGGFTGDLGDGAWARKDYQAGSLNFPFTEDCTFSYAIQSNPGSPWVTYHDMGGRSVLRHCQIDGTRAPNGITGPVDFHGNQSIWRSGANNYRGTIRFEFYGNEVKLGNNIYQIMDARGGSCIVHDNVFTTKDGSSPNIVDFRDEESDPNNTPGVPLRSPVKWPCEDQINASFIWGNTLNGRAHNKVGVGGFGNSDPSTGDPFYIKEGRDYWLKAPDSGTKTTYPAPGNPSASDYPAPYESLQVTSYTPAPYPHPLNTEDAGGGGEQPPPDGGGEQPPDVEQPPPDGGGEQPPVEQPPPSELKPPPRAAAAGFDRLVFEDDFTSLDIAFGENTGQKWNAGLWWDKIPDRSCFECSGTALKITVPPGEDHIDLCTQWHNQTTTPSDTAGIRFEPGGYFEARICTFNWDAFWLFCWNRPWNWGSTVNPDDPMTWTNEIDILESDGGYPTWVWNTLHKNTSSDGLPDEQNWPHIAETNKTMVGEWHDYGVLWTKDLLTFFLDGMPVREVKPYESTWQPVQLILTAGIGGVGGSPSKTKPEIIRVDWVRVWQGSGTKKAEPEPAMASGDARRVGPKRR